MKPDPELDDARQLAGLSLEQLWYAYLALGGSTPIEVLAANIADATGLSDYEHDLIGHAINERFMDIGADRLVPYRRSRARP